MVHYLSSSLNISNDDERSSNESMEELREAEITASILEVNGGPIPTDSVIVQKSKDRLKFHKNILMRSLLNNKKNYPETSKKIDTKKINEKQNSRVQRPNLTQHPDDIDFYCLVDTTKKITKEEEKENNNYFFEFRGKRNIEYPHHYYFNCLNDDSFQFNS